MAEGDGVEPARRGSKRLRLPAGLPAFGPTAMRFYVAIWSLLLVAAIAMPLLGVYTSFSQRAEPGWPSIGINVTDDPEGIVVTLVHGDEARARGLRPGDRIVAIDGRPVPRGLGADDRVRGWILGPERSRKRLTIVSAATPPRNVVLIRSSEVAEARYRDAGLSSTAVRAILAVAMLAASLMLVVAAVLLFRQRRQPVAALLSLGCLGLSAFSLAGGLAVGPLGLWVIRALLQPLSWMCILLALIAMPDGRFASRWAALVALAIIVNAPLDMTRLLPNGAVLGVYIALILAAVISLALRYRSSVAPERQQLRWAFLGFACGTAMLVLALAVQALAAAWARADPRWDIWSDLIAVPLYTLGMSAYAIGLIVSLLRYRLYDADAVIGRSAGYAVLTLLLAGTFGASAKLIEWFVETSFGGDAGAWPGAIGAGLAVVMITPMHRRIHDWAERHFQKELIHLRRDLPDAAGDLRETASLAELLDDVLTRVERATHVVGAAIAIDGAIVARHGTDGPWLHEVPITIAHQGRAVGTLLVGPRPDGTPIGKDERDALAAVADPIGRAVRIVTTREARQTALDRRLADLEKRIAAAPAGDRRSGAPKS